MNRLFWKILLVFWFSLLSIINVLALPSWLKEQHTQQVATELIANPLSIISIKAAALTFKHGGKSALVNLLTEQHEEAPDAMQVYALDPQNRELLGRHVDPLTLQAVHVYPASDLSIPILRLVTQGNEQFILFAPWSGQFSAFTNKQLLHFSQKHQDDLLELLAIVIASFVASAFLARYFAHPVKVLESGFKALATGDLNCRVANTIGKRQDELANLGLAFDTMAEQLQNLISQQTTLVDAQRNLLNDVSHELRSPLTRLMMSIALARQQPERLNTSLERIEQEAERLNKLVSEILTLSKLETGLSQPEKTYIDLIALLQMLIPTLNLEATAQQQCLKLHLPAIEELIICANGELLYRAIENIVRNAIQYSPPHTSIELWLELQQTQVAIRVEDQGLGLTTHELTHIFEAFYRGSKTKQVNGYGLGLAIAKRAISFHGGSIQAQNKITGGLQIQILLPLTED